ncbi:MAG: type II toxin-antitoxin system HicA family toxin [Acidimicrobiales bacterium]
MWLVGVTRSFRTWTRPSGIVKVREIISELERAGWVQIRQTGSHRHYQHAVRSESVCVAGHLGDEIPKGTLGNIVRQAGLERRPR